MGNGKITNRMEGLGGIRLILIYIAAIVTAALVVSLIQGGPGG